MKNKIKNILRLAIVSVFYSGSNMIFAETEISSPPMKSPPAIDGTISLDEWKCAVKLTGVAYGDNIDSRQCDFWIGYDLQNIYFAVRSKLPPGGKLVTKIPRKEGFNNQVFHDDSIEFFLVPPSPRLEGLFQFGFFQIIINSEGTVFARHHNPGFGLPAKEWQLDFQQKHSFTKDGYWEAEVAIPVSQTGIKEITLPMQWRFLFSRNFQYPQCQGTMTPIRTFTNKEKFAVLNCNSNAQVVQVSGAPSGSSNHFPLTVSIFNPGDKVANVNSNIKLEYKSKSPVVKKATFTINPGKKVTYNITGDLKKNQECALTLEIKDDRGVIDYKRQTMYQFSQKRKWTNLYSYLRFEQTFDRGINKADLAAVAGGKKLTSRGKPRHLIGGKNKKGKYLHLPTGSSITYAKENFAVPGAISCWVRSTRELNDKEKRFIWYSKYKKDGFIWLIQDKHAVMLGIQYFPGIQKARKFPIIRKTLKQKVGQWRNYVINLDAGKAVMFIDGVESGHAAFPAPLLAKQLSDLLVGNPNATGEFDVDEFKIYNRILSQDEITKIAMGDSTVDGKISYFPSIQKFIIEANLNPEELPERASLTLVLEEVKSQQAIFNQLLDFKKNTITKENGFMQLRQMVKVSNLNDGVYTAFLEVTSKANPDYTKQLLKRQIHIKKYPWENNTLGKSDIIVPPFEPLSVHGKNVSCVLRTYQLNTMGLPESVIAKGEQILASPVKCVVKIKNKVLAWNPISFEFTEKRNTKVSYKSEAENKLLKLNISGEFDYDGLLKLKIKFTPRTADSIDRIYIDIPVKKQFAKLFHAAGERVRSNPAGKIPDGKEMVWKSRSIPQPHISNFIPYIWVGEEERGICYVADWDKNWIHCQERDAIELIRKKDNVIIRLNLINGPVTLKNEREIEIALMASPVKPMPKGWRGWADASAVMGGLPGNKHLQCLGAHLYWGSYYGWTGRYPAFEDFTYITKLNETRKTGIIDKKFISEWLKRIQQAPPEEIPYLLDKSKGADCVPNHTRVAFEFAKGLSKTGTKNVFYPYTCLSDRSNRLPENKVYGDEWQYREPVHVTPSFSDYGIYYAAKMMEHGFNGIYLDNTFFTAKYTWPTGDGYIDKKGKIHPSLGLWRIRNYIKRMAVMMHEKGIEPFICVHHTNGNVLPTLSFATNSMGMEWKYGESDFQERFTPDYIRAVNIGRQGGFFPTSLDGIQSSKDKRAWLTRTMLAVLLPHEIQPTAGIGTDRKTYRKIAQILWDFGKAAPEAIFHPYWAEDTPVKTKAEDLIISAYQVKNKLMLVIGNYGGDVTAGIHIDCKQLGYARIAKAVNAEIPQAVPFEKNTLTLTIKKHDLALIEVVMDEKR
jgi:glycosyl hydrolase family 123/concanavalin A-like lectin/glucanase superfamily protein